MNKLHLTLPLALLLALATGCRSYDGLMSEYRHAEGAEYHHAGPALFGLARMLSPKEGAAPLRSIRKMRSLDLSDCTPAVRERFAQQALRYTPRRYEPLVTANDGDEHARILVRQRRGTIRELLIISVDGDECIMTQIKGRVSPKHVGRWLAGQERRH